MCCQTLSTDNLIPKFRAVANNTLSGQVFRKKIKRAKKAKVAEVKRGEGEGEGEEREEEEEEDSEEESDSDYLRSATPTLQPNSQWLCRDAVPTLTFAPQLLRGRE